MNFNFKLNLRRALAMAICLVGFGVSANAQTLRSNYNDGKALVYIEQIGHKTAVCNPRNNDRHDRLQFQNISSSNITIKYSYKELRYNCDDIFQLARISYGEVTLTPGQSDYKSAGLTNGKVGYSYIESFSIIYVSGGTSSNSSYGTQQSSSVPDWVIGRWGNYYAYLCTINTSGVTWHDGNIADFVRIEGDILWFKYRQNQALVRITKISNNDLHYHNPTTGSAYALKRY